MVFRSFAAAVLTLCSIACRPAPAAPVDADAQERKAPAARAAAAPALPDCERHAATLATAAGQHGAAAPVAPIVRGAFNFYQEAFRAPCSPDIEWKVASIAVRLLDDARVLSDHTASESKRVLVQDAAVVVLERASGGTQGAYEPVRVDAKPEDAARVAKANAETRERWKAWWTTAQHERDKWIESANKKRTEEQLALEQKNLTKLMASQLSVLHSWDLVPWTSDSLSPTDVVKKPGFVAEMLQPPVHPSLFEEVKWGWYLKKDGIIYRVLRREEPGGKEWRLDAYRQELAKAPGDPKLIVEWTIADKLPLAAVKPGQSVGVPPAFVEWLRQRPPVYFSVLASGSFGATVVEGERVYLIALRGGELPM